MNQNNTIFKIIIGVVVALLLVGIVLGTLAYINGKDNTDNTNETTDTDITEATTGDVVTTDVSDGGKQLLHSGKVYAMPKLMTFTQVSALSRTASEGITVNATVKPDTAVNKNVTWQVAWENPNETFASGKTATDYISVTPLAAGSSTATITCLQPFGSTIQVSVISESNPGVYAILTVDYEKRVEDVSGITTNEDYYFDGTTLYLDDTSGWSYLDANYSDNWDIAYTYGVGSVDSSSVSSTSFYIKASDELAVAYSGAATDYVSIKDNRNDLLEKGLGVTLFRTMEDKTKEPFEDLQEDGSVILSYPTISVFNAIQWNNIVSAFSGLEGHAFDMKVVVTTQSGNVSEVIIPIYIDTDSVGAQVASITVDQTNIVV